MDASPLGDALNFYKVAERPGLNDFFPGSQAAVQYEPLIYLWSVIQSVARVDQIIAGRRDALYFSWMSKEVFQSFNHVVLVGEDAILHVVKASRLQCCRPFRHETGVRPWNLEVFAHDLAGHGSACGHDEARVEGARIGLSCQQLGGKFALIGMLRRSQAGISIA